MRKSRKFKTLECNFMKNLISDVKKLLVDCCSCNNPLPVPKSERAVGISELEYETVAANTEVVTLTLVGFIAYIYDKAFNEPYPLENPTPIEIARIYEIYDSLNIPRPIL